MAFDPSSRRVSVFGGVDHLAKPSVRYADTWAWDGKTWTELSRGGPSARIWPAMAYDPNTRRMLLFGGADPPKVLNDLWLWDGSRWTELKLAHSPAPRWHFAMVGDEARRQVVLFGGVDTTGTRVAYGDTWVWDGRDWRQASNNGPGPRFGHAMSYDRARRKIVLYGGRDNSGRALGDTWEWDGTTWRELATAGPGPRLLHGLAFDEIRRAVILFGGWNPDDSSGASAYLSDTWELKGSQWTRLQVSGPGGSRAHYMVNDVRRRRVVLFGGYSAVEVFGSTWEWNGRTWQLRR